METTSRWWIECAWYLSSQRLVLVAPVWVRVRDRFDQRSGVGMSRSCKHVIGGADFGKPAEIHNRNALADVLDDG